MTQVVPKQVAAAIAVRDGRVLVTKRATGQKLEGYWEFPGGKLEGAETPAECIVRELKEELGVWSTAGAVITEALHAYPGGAINLIAIEVELTGSDFALTVHDEAKWVLPSELLQLELAPADIPIARTLMGRSEYNQPT